VLDATGELNENADVGVDIPIHKKPEPRGLHDNWNVNAPETDTKWDAKTYDPGIGRITNGVFRNKGTIEAGDTDGVPVLEEVKVDVEVDDPV
jgi:hypothetical protein